MPRFKSLAAVRAEIDRIDEKLVRLMAERMTCVEQAAHFKKSVADIKAPKRAKDVLRRVRRLAKRHRIDPNTIEQIYRSLIQEFIKAEVEMHAPR
jgi:isochorismate pyruvate lyase